MIYRAREAAETSALILISGVLFVLFFTLNNWVFAAIEYRQGINWIFLPAGFRVILVLVMGLPASVGIMAGTWFIDRSVLETTQYSISLMNGIVSGFTPWLVMKAMDSRQQFGAFLQHFSSAQLLNFTLIYAICNALAHHLCWWLFDSETVNLLVDVWPMFVGDAIGALLMLYAFKGIAHWISSKPPSSL